MKSMKIPDEFVPRFQSPGINICVCVPEKLREALIERAYQLSNVDELVSMGEVTRQILMAGLMDKEGDPAHG